MVTMDAGTIIPIGLVLAGVAMALILRLAWRRRGALNGLLIIGGWLLFGAAVVAAAPLLGEARGPFIALALIPVGALIVVASGITIREARIRSSRDVALEPSERPSRAWRGWLRALLAGPIGMIAAMGVGIAWTVWVPGEPQTRIVVGGILVPILWGGAMAWTLSDDKIIRATAVLLGVAITTFALSALKGFS